jgi:hypothetical protein
MKLHVKVIQSCNPHKPLSNESIMADASLQTKVCIISPRKEHYPIEQKMPSHRKHAMDLSQRSDAVPQNTT